MTARITATSPRWVRWVIDESTGCWNWLQRIDRQGYGRVHSGLAHRRIWEDVNGRVPDGLELDHLCRNRRCVNPAHLEPVTSEENRRRGLDARGFTAGREMCSKGHSMADAYVESSGRRKCRECHRRWALDWYYRQKLADEPRRPIKPFAS